VERELSTDLAGRQRAEAFMAVLSRSLGFMGNREDYYDPRNSFLNDVLDRRTGLPITLSLICMAVGQRVGLSVYGVGYPGHFMAGLRSGDDLWLLDLFTARVLSPKEVPGHLAALFQQPLNFVHQMGASPVSSLSLVRRILNNLWNIYHSQDDFSNALWVLDYMLALTPDDPRLWQERGTVAYQAGRLLDAGRSLRRYLYLTGHLGRFLGLDGGVILEDLDGSEVDLGEVDLGEVDLGENDLMDPLFGEEREGNEGAEAEPDWRRTGYRAAPAPADDDDVWEILGLLSQVNEELQRMN